MKTVLLALAAGLCATTAGAQQMASYQGYIVCPASQTQDGIDVVAEACGRLTPPAIPAAGFSSVSELREAQLDRETFTADVDNYGACVNQLINSYRRPGAPADSAAPDQAACAHAWAEDQATQIVMDYGRACVDFSNRSMTDATIEPWSGSCYPEFGSENG
ncbi:MAG: hypothetical protein AAFQ21_09370 [Pseudomonadota bacterium]